ncbi:MAG: DUF998 domain-containing protein [Actinophytocola sp.]|nr:DUF998 domain-containing protein [Actinophytocola sp.]
MNDTTCKSDDFDMAAAVTRSLLGWGVVAGVWYLTVGIILGLTRDGFAFSKHPLSVLMLGDYGWLQQTNIILAGVMVIAAAVGFLRAMRPARWAGGLIAGFGVCLIASGVFPPDPMAGFPAGASEGQASVSGLLHLAFGAVGFLLLAAAAFVVARWYAARADASVARNSRIAGAVIALAFVAGAALSASAAGVLILWIAVVAAWAWLAALSISTYRTVPHPDCSRAVPDTAHP